MVSHYEDGKIVHRSVNACLCPLYAVDNMHVVTVEGEHRQAVCVAEMWQRGRACSQPRQTRNVAASTAGSPKAHTLRNMHAPAASTSHQALRTAPHPATSHRCTRRHPAGIGNPRDGLHPVQAVLAKSHGSQCGFCTPGFVMSMYSLLRSSKEAPSEEEVEDALGGNLW